MSQYFLASAGIDAIVMVDATSGNETVTLPRGYASGRKLTVRRKDSSGYTVSVAPPAGLALDGVADGTVSVGGDSEVVFIALETAAWESLGLTPSKLAQDAAFKGTYAQLASAVSYDVLVLAGQSNMSGRGGTVDTRLDVRHPRIYTYDTIGTYANTIVAADEPLGHADRTTLTNSLGPALVFARYYADTMPPGRRLLLVPVAYGGTGFSSSAGTDVVTLQWDPALSGNLYTQAIAQANAAMIAAGANARLAGFLWVQGEYDASAGMTAAAYQVKLDALIAGFRAGISGASSTTPFVVGSMAPGFLTATGANAATISAVHVATPSRVSYAGYGQGPSGLDGGLHYTAAGYRLLGLSMWGAYQLAKSNTPPTPAVPTAPTNLTATAGDASVLLAWTAATSSTSPLSDYVVQYRTTNGPGTWTTFSHSASVAASITVTALTNTTGYDFRVAGVNTTGTSTYSGTVSATPAAPVFADNFTRTNSSTTLGSTSTGSLAWSALSGTWGISSNAGYCATGISSGNAVAVVDSGQANGTFSYTVAADGSGGGNTGAGGLVIRATDDNNYWMLSTAGTLYKKVSGSFTQAVAGALVPSVGDVFTIVANGTSISAYRNGALLGSTTDSFNSTATKHGMRSYNNLTAVKCSAISQR